MDHRCTTCHFTPCRCEDLASGQTPGGHRPANWPLHSDALGVQPYEREEAHKQAEALGVPTEFDRMGRAILRDNAHRNQLMKAMGYHDRDACYGQRTK